MEAAYKRRIIVVGQSYRGCKRDQVRCPERASDLATGSLEAYFQAQNGTGWYPKWENIPLPPEPRIYRFYFNKAEGLVGGPVE